MSNLKQFLELFNQYPGNSYLEISNGVSEITIALEDLLSQVDGNLDLVMAKKCICGVMDCNEYF